MAAQKATDIRRVLADVETKAKLLRDHQGEVEIQLLAAPAASWIEAAAKARYVLNLYAAVSRRQTPITATWSRRCWRTLPGSPVRA